MSEQKTKFSFNKDRWLNTITIGLFAIGVICVVYVLTSSYSRKRSQETTGNLDCVKETSILTANDEFMSGVVKKGENIKVLENFYNCNEVSRGDLAWYRFSNQIAPVVRTVRGLPGDKYTLTQTPDKKDAWKISINGEDITAPDGLYYIYSNSVPPLKTYEISRGGILLADEYILLSNVSPGLSDSSNLGLIRKKDLAGKVLLTK